MKINLAFSLLLCATALLLASCATNRVDWNSRIGNYTFDQAVTELGPPDKQARLSDGKTVAEWVTRHNSGSSVSFGTGFYGYPGSVGYMQSVGPNYYETKFRLTFTTNNILEKWSRD